MSKNVLIACPNDVFGELLRISLEENGDYQVRVVKNGQEMLALAAEVRFDLVIIDAEIGDQPPAALAKKVMTQYPDLRVAIIPPGNNPLHPSLTGVVPDAYLSRPFFMPDLMRILENLFPLEQPAAEAIGEPQAGKEKAKAPLEELMALAADDQRRFAEAFNVLVKDGPMAETPAPTAQSELKIDGLAKELESLAQEPRVYAVVIASRGQVLAYTGRLLKSEADNLARILSCSWDPVVKSDLINYGQLSENKDVLYYTVALLDQLVLSIIFDADQPISKARSRAAQLARTLRDYLAAPAAEGAPALSERSAEEDHLVSLADLLVDAPAPKLPKTSSGPGDGWVQESSPNGI